MAKDINIPVSVEGAEQAKSKIESVGRAGKELGSQLESGQTQAAGAVDKTSEKLTFLDRILGRVHSQVYRFVASWLGLIGVQRLISWLIERLEKIVQLQKEIYDKSIPLLELGQGLEAATGTKNRQQYWAEQVSGVAAAGGLKSPEIAQQMMLAANAVYGKQGGIGNKNVLDFIKGISPFFGAQQLSADDASKLIEFAGAAGVPAEKKAFYSFVAKLQAASKTTGAKTFGEFFTGAREPLAAFMAAGGSLDKGLSLYTVSRGAAGEGGAAAMMEGILKLATGLDKKEQHAVERTMKVDWSKLSTDQRIETLSKYVGGLPPQHRERILKRWGFPAEAGELFDKLSGPKAAASAAEMQKYLQQTTAEAEQAKAETFPTTPAGKEAVSQATVTTKQLKTVQRFRDWTRRLRDAQEQFKINEVSGDRAGISIFGKKFGIPVPESSAVDYLALVSLLGDYEKYIIENPWDESAVEARQNLKYQIDRFNPILPRQSFLHEIRKVGQLYSGALNTLEQSRNMTIVNDHSLILNPVVGDKSERRIGPRAGRESGR